MKKRNVLAALAAAAAMFGLIGPLAPAQAVDPEVTFTFSPTSGPPGTTIGFSGTGCVHDPNKDFDGVFFLARGNANTSPVQFVSDAQGGFTGTYDTAAVAAGAYTTFASCTNTGKGGPGSPFTVTEPPGSTYFPIAPVRVLDTRAGIGTAGLVNPVGPGGVLDVKVTDLAGVPASGVTAVALNITATNATGPLSYLTVWPTSAPQPFASNLNFAGGIAVPNLVIAKVGTGGKVSIYNNTGGVDVIADVQGWYSNAGPVGSRYVPVNPQRMLDTRDGTGVVGAAQVGPGGVVELGVTGIAGVPGDATAVVLNMTVDRATGPESFLTVWPSGSSRPTASNLNFSGGPASTNLVIARVGAGGKVAIYNSVGATDIIADVQGWFAPAGSPIGSTYFATNPARILDSRDGTGVPGGAVGQLGTQNTLELTVAGVGGVPSSGVTAVVLNVTVADSPGPESYLTLFPAGTARPVASNINFVAGETIPNLVIVRVLNGRVSIFNNVGSTNVIADVQGWFTGAA